MGRLLRRRGERVGTVVVTVPVSARGSAGAAQLGNAVGIMPLGPAHDRRRPVAVAAGGRDHQGTQVRDPRHLGRDGRSGVPHPGHAGCAGLVVNHQRLVHTFVTNLCVDPTTCDAGRVPVSAVVPVSAINGNVTVAFGALSYAGTLTVTVIVDPDSVPDPRELAAALQAELDELARGG